MQLAEACCNLPPAHVSTASQPLHHPHRRERRFMEAHRDVIKQWGRFPHRNVALGRQSTAEEEEGMAAGTIAKF